MIKMSGTHGKRKVILLGLSEGNLMRLREKKPIIIHAEEMMIDHDIIICWGQTEEALAKELGHLISSETVVRDHRDDKKN